jgi:hypothetical protein
MLVASTICDHVKERVAAQTFDTAPTSCPIRYLGVNQMIQYSVGIYGMNYCTSSARQDWALRRLFMRLAIFTILHF